ncbi:MAG TPA: chemotaxis protein CheD [Polyangiaceae bacterium]|nr:chemotaxis protein CheD [Polyangiaceae bacterium]
MLAERLAPQEVLYVEPGQLLVCAEPKRLRTILGSCVSVCFYDPELRIGGMNHFMLPRAPGGSGGGFRYGDAAMHGLLERMQRLGCQPRQLCAHVYGGAKVLAAISGMTHLGQGNVDFALDWLDERGITIVSSGVLGTWARRLDLDVASGACSEQLLGTR